MPSKRPNSVDGSIATLIQRSAMATTKTKSADHLVRVSNSTYLALIERQLELVRAGKQKPTLGEVVAMFVKK